MNNNNKVISLVLGAIVALFALSLLLRFVVLSQAGIPVGWIFLGLPFAGIGLLLLLLRLGLLGTWGSQFGWWDPQHNSSVQTPSLASPPPAASVSQRLQELDTLRASGAMSDTEYTEIRQGIISNM
jgi:energy-coupling factor transporter transmembrane protein EcfT